LRQCIVADDHAGPHRAQQLSAPNHLAAPMRELHQHLDRLGLEAHGFAVSNELVACGVDAPGAHGQGGAGCRPDGGGGRHPQHFLRKSFAGRTGFLRRDRL